MTRPVNVTFDDATYRSAKLLAQANTNGNISRLLSLLIHTAAIVPDQYGLIDPRTALKAEPDTKSTTSPQ